MSEVSLFAGGPVGESGLAWADRPVEPIESVEVARAVMQALREALVRKADADLDVMLLFRRIVLTRAWVLMGYVSLQDCCAAEFSDFQIKRTRGERERLLSSMAVATGDPGAGLSVSEWSALLGVPGHVVRRDVKRLGAAASAAKAADEAKRAPHPDTARKVALAGQIASAAREAGVTDVHETVARELGVSRTSATGYLAKASAIEQGVIPAGSPYAEAVAQADMSSVSGLLDTQDVSDSPGTLDVPDVPGVFLTGVADALRRYGGAAEDVLASWDGAALDADGFYLPDLAAEVVQSGFARLLSRLSVFGTHLGLDVPATIAAGEAVWRFDPRIAAVKARVVYAWVAAGLEVADAATVAGVDLARAVALLAQVEALPESRRLAARGAVPASRELPVLEVG